MMKYGRRALVAALGVAPVVLARGVAATEIVLSEQFTEELADGGFAFDDSVFADFEPARILANPHMDYEHAVRHVAVPLEIRYALRRGELPNTKQAFESEVIAVFHNMAAKDREDQANVRIREFGEEDVGKEFNADFGWTGVFTPDATFARYTAGLCTVIGGLQQQARGYTIFLYNGTPNGMSEEVSAVMQRTFHALYFA